MLSRPTLSFSSSTNTEGGNSLLVRASRLWNERTSLDRAQPTASQKAILSSFRGEGSPDAGACPIRSNARGVDFLGNAALFNPQIHTRSAGKAAPTASGANTTAFATVRLRAASSERASTSPVTASRRRTNGYCASTSSFEISRRRSTTDSMARCIAAIIRPDCSSTRRKQLSTTPCR